MHQISMTNNLNPIRNLHGEIFRRYTKFPILSIPIEMSVT